MIVSTLSVFFSGSKSTRLLKHGMAGHTVEIVDVSWMEKPWDRSSRSIMLRTPPGFGVCDAWGVCDWLVAGAQSSAARARIVIERSAMRMPRIDTCWEIPRGGGSRENAGGHEPVSGL